MATITKSNVKQTYPSWFTQLHARSKAAKDVRNDSTKLRGISEATRIQTDSKTKYDQLDTNNRLYDGINTIRQWRDVLERLLQRLHKRMSALRDAKAINEDYLVKLMDAQHVTVESMTYLDHRRYGEYINDPVEKELTGEKKLLEELQKDLQSQILEAIEAQLRLQEIHSKIERHLREKTEAMILDIDLHNMNEKSSHVHFKPFATRTPSNRIDVQTWDDQTRKLVEKANEELDRAEATIHRLHLGVHQAANRMGAKDDRVGDAIRLRIYDTERAIRELQHQKEMTEREKDKLLREIQNLIEARKAKLASLKLAQTRLEGRQAKPLDDNVDDPAHAGLMQELSALTESVDALDAQIDKARDMIRRLEVQLANLCQDIQMKHETLEIFQQLINIRKRLERPPQTRYPYCPFIPKGIVREPRKF